MAPFDTLYKRLTDAVPIKNVTSHFAMERKRLRFVHRAALQLQDTPRGIVVHLNDGQSQSEISGYSERLQDAVARYHNHAISTVEVLHKLIAIARDLRAARCRGEKTGLAPE